MGFFSFGKSKVIVENPKQKAENEKLSAKDWLPVKGVKEGIILLKNGEYVKIVEVIPINFKLKSKTEKRILISNYRSFLKGCKFPMQISVQCRKANIEPHVNRMKSFYETEKNPQVKSMIKGYINLVSQIGTNGTITRRYFIIFPYLLPVGIKASNFNDVVKQMKEKSTLIKEYLHACGNEVLESSDNEI